MILVAGNKLKESKVSLKKDKKKVMRKKANKKIKMVAFEPNPIRFKLTDQKRGAY